MKPVSMYILKFILLFSMVTYGQVVTDGEDQPPPTDLNFTYFTNERNTGQLVLRSTKAYFNLKPYAGTSSTQYKVKNFEKKLDFFINNRSSKPIQQNTYVGVEIIRLYIYNKAVSKSVHLYRNPDWVDSNGNTLPQKDLDGPVLDEFVRDHSRDEQVKDYLISWHAHLSKNGPSSWKRRGEISNGFGKSTNRNDQFPNIKYNTAQGTYRLIRFSESEKPSARKPVCFTLEHHGARYLLIRVFAPENGKRAYDNQYLLELVQ